jgi:hypothetical protein
MPFQMRPDSRVTLEFRAASDRMMLPFRMLRCYVTSLRGGVQYQAAGEFEQRLDWKPLQDVADAHATSERLIATLEAFLRHASPVGRVVEFDHLLMWILDAARRGERADRIAAEIRQRLMQFIPSIAIAPAAQSSLPDPTRGARFFGFDFSSERALTTPDRRLLRTAAQLLSIVKDNGERPLRATPTLDFKPRHNTESPVIAYNVTDWLKMRESDGFMAQHDPWLRTA